MTKVIGSKRCFSDYDDALAIEFVEDVCDIAGNEEFLKLKNYTHHHSTTRYQHCVNVAWYTFLWAKKMNLNAKSAARGAMLHDFFVYNYHTEQPIPGRHSSVHPKIALQNAEKYFYVDPVMRDVIVHHMWPSAPGMPRTPEGYLITVADKYCASIELGSRVYKYAVQFGNRILAFGD